VRANRQHGVDFSIDGPPFAIAEAGYQINGLPGDNQPFGNYKLGAWYDDSEFTSFNSGAKTRGSWGLYGLFDHVLLPFGTPRSLVASAGSRWAKFQVPIRNLFSPRNATGHDRSCGRGR
jgi:hypothetical protein